MPDAATLRDALVPWYRAHRRDLPWRRSPTPYRVLLSEIMLQQTRVETVIPYFHRFLERWPTVEALAAADLDDVLHAWAGLGYYRRARALHAAAQAAVEAGGLPADVEGLRALPGIGPYTAGAIASIAHGLPVPAVDGNVERVMCRVHGIDGNPRTAAGRRAVEAAAAAVTAEGVASEVTQGLMELGATVCTPRNPTCGACPWGEGCVARATDRIADLPALPARKKPVPVQGVAGLLRRGPQVLLGKRPPGLLGGLWEPVLGEVDAPGPDALVGVFRQRVGLDVTVTADLGEVVHVFTHRRLTLRVFAVEAPAAARVVSDGSYEDLAFVEPGTAGLGLSKLALKVLAAGEGTLPFGAGR